MFRLFATIGRYFMLMGKVFSRPEKISIYRSEEHTSELQSQR